MRGIRFAAFAVAGLLSCQVIHRVLEFAPAPEVAQPAAAIDSTRVPSQPRVSAPVVPPPPPLPGSRPARSGISRRRPTLPVIADELGSGEAQGQEYVAAVELPAGEGDAEEAVTAQRTAEDDAAPKGLVIVIPPESPKQDNRGVRWMKAMGRALHVSGRKDIETESFRTERP